MSFKTKVISFMLLLVMIISFAFSGCDIGDISGLGMEELMHPPMPDGEKYKIKLLLDTLVKGTITFVSPKSGDFTEAFTEYDIDHNGQNEVVVFYREKLNGVTTEYIRVFYKEGNNWMSGDSISVGEDSVSSLNFYDLDKDGVDEIVVSWENSGYEPSTRTLAIYEYASRRYVGSLKVGGEIYERDTKDCDDFTVVDLQNDGMLELVVVTLEHEAKVYVYKYVYEESDQNQQEGKHLLLLGDDALTLKDNIEVGGEIKIKGKITGYAGVASSEYVSVTDGTGKLNEYFPRVMVDCFYRIEGDSEERLRTFMIYCEKKDVSSSQYVDKPTIFDYGAEMSVRKSEVTSRDINADGIVDLPVPVGFVNTKYQDTTGLIVENIGFYTEKSMVSWKTFDGTGLFTSEYTFLNSEANYVLTIPEEWINDIYFEDNSSDGEYIFYKWDFENNKKLEPYVTVKISYWEAEEDWESQGYVAIGTNKAGTLVYAIRKGNYEGSEYVKLTINK